MKLKVVSLSSFIEAQIEEGLIQEYLSSFRCSKNKEVESFLHNQAVKNEKREFTKTSLVITDEDDSIVGFFTLMVKIFMFTTASKTNRQKIANDKNATHFNTMLIAQIGRDDSYKDVVKGSHILDLALEKCNIVHETIGLRIVCVEYDPIPQLKHFYSVNGFRVLQENHNGKEIAFIKL